MVGDGAEGELVHCIHNPILVSRMNRRGRECGRQGWLLKYEVWKTAGRLRL